MKAISIRQPWAWLIVNRVKPVENCDWTHAPGYRGPLLIHASKSGTKKEYAEAIAFAHSIDDRLLIPSYADVQRGGVVGVAELTDIVRSSKSPWFTGPIGLELRNAYALPLHPCKGQLMPFEVALPEDYLKALKRLGLANEL